MHPMMQPQKIRVGHNILINLMVDIERGNLRIPRFQREFVWERIRIQTLLDSMFKEYPIGTLFFWDAPAKYNHLLRHVEDLRQPSIESSKSYTFILDGQQRLTSLYAVIKGLTIDGEDYGKIVIDLANQDLSKLSFQYRTPDNQRWVSVKDLLSSNFTVFNSLSEEYRIQFQKYFNKLTSYPFSVVSVGDVELDDAVEIFERINQQGKKLSRYDLIAATVLTERFDLREKTEQDILSKLRPIFGEVPETSITQALSLNLRNRTESSSQMSLRPEEVEPVWKQTVECFMLAVDFVRQNLGVARSDFLPYDAILPVLAYYFYYGKTRKVSSPKHREQLERWFWRVAFSERYSGASQTRMTEDAAWIRDLIEKGKEVEHSITINLSSLIDGSMTYSASAIRNGVLCILNLRQPLHFENATRIQIEGEHFVNFIRPERHHIFPVSFLEAQGRSRKEVHLIPNFCFIPQELNVQISNQAPSIYMQELKDLHGQEHFERVMNSHLIPTDEDSGIWNDNYDRFVRQRAQLLINEIKRRCGLPDSISEEFRNPVIDIIENCLRETIHIALSNAHGENYWRQDIPGDVDTRITERIEKQIAKTPGLSKSQFQNPRTRLDFCDVSDYSKIMLKNWNLFSTDFRSKLDCERYLQDFKEFRDATKHNRNIDRILNYRAQAAITWLSEALNVDLTEYGVV
jgi:hypothetical protein